MITSLLGVVGVAACAAQPASLHLTLNEAILLGVRQNPNVVSAQLSDVLQKFNYIVARWAFSPHYAINGSATYNHNKLAEIESTQGKNFSLEPTVSWQFPVGTQLSLTAANSYSTNYHPSLSLQLTQPLMRGFGSAIVEAALNNAKDALEISSLAIEGTLRNTVTNIINAYLVVLSAQESIVIDQKALARAEMSQHQTELFIQAGHKAGNELITVKANVASAKSQLENDVNNLEQARFGLLAAIGIDPNAKVEFAPLDLESLEKRYQPVALSRAQAAALAHDIQYQVDNLVLNGQTMRNLATAKDHTRWQLNLSASAMVGSGTDGTNVGINGLLNGENQAQNIGLSLVIPIGDKAAQQELLSAKIAIKQARLALQQERWSLETNAINTWNSVQSAERALHFAKDAEKLQQDTYQLNYQKYIHGLIDSLELQTAQLQLTQAQQASLNAQMNYIKALVQLDLLMGHTLSSWEIKVRT